MLGITHPGCLLSPTTMKVDIPVTSFQVGKLKFSSGEKCVQNLTGGSQHQSQDEPGAMWLHAHTQQIFIECLPHARNDCV